MSKQVTDSFMEKVFLRSDNGAELYFRGRVYSETSYYDEETTRLTRLRLFVSEDGQQVFSIISGSGGQKTRRHYVVSSWDDMCRISDGVQTLTMPSETLFAAVFGLCGIDPSRAEELKTGFEESLRIASG